MGVLSAPGERGQREMKTRCWGTPWKESVLCPLSGRMCSVEWEPAGKPWVRRPTASEGLPRALWVQLDAATALRSRVLRMAGRGPGVPGTPRGQATGTRETLSKPHLTRTKH